MLTFLWAGEAHSGTFEGDFQWVARQQVQLRLREGGLGLFSARDLADVSYVAATSGALHDLVRLF